MKRISISITLAITFSVIISGCSSTHLPNRDIRKKKAYVYYLDGAGGGGLLMNWSSGVKTGLIKAGYNGAGEMFKWETGLGVGADQTASNEYKRAKARELARKITAFRRENPNTPITIIGLSAGTAIAVFTLEALPADIKVDDVILLSGSLSSTYDLTRALRHIRNKMYIFTSHRDAVLQVLMPFGGTADRGSGTTATIGVNGPTLPHNASDETRQLYKTKIVEIPWKKEFERYGNFGGHTDTVKAGFVQHYVAPLIIRTSSYQAESTQLASAKSEHPSGQVENPDYRRWANFAPGTWTIINGTETIDGQSRPIRLKITLIKKTPDSIMLERKEFNSSSQTENSIYSQYMFASKYISPTMHPATHPNKIIKILPAKTIVINGKAFHCQGKYISSKGKFYNWGLNPKATLYVNPDIPGGIAELEIETQIDNKKLQFKGKLTDYYIAGNN